MVQKVGMTGDEAAAIAAAVRRYDWWDRYKGNHSFLDSHKWS